MKKWIFTSPGHKSNGRRITFLFLCLVSLNALTLCSGQEQPRSSLASETAARARRHERTTAQENAQVGPVGLDLVAELGTQVTDNLRFASKDGEADWILRPQLSARIDWSFSEAVALTTKAGLGYSAYALHPEFNRLFVTPDSEISLDAYIGNLWINLHDQLSVTEEAYADPTLVGTPDYSQLQNRLGPNITWDLSRIVLRLGYEHTLYAQLSGRTGLGDGSSDFCRIAGAYKPKQDIEYGAETGAGLITYDGDPPFGNKALEWNVGAFAGARLWRYLKISAEAGFTSYKPQPGGSRPSFDGLYGRLSARHQVNRFLDYDLTVGRSVSLGFYAGTIELFNVMTEAQWHLLRGINLSTGFLYEQGSQLLTNPETFDRFGPTFCLQSAITERISGTLRYQYYLRNSNKAGQDYAVNLVTLNFIYNL